MFTFRQVLCRKISNEIKWAYTVQEELIHVDSSEMSLAIYISLLLCFHPLMNSENNETSWLLGYFCVFCTMLAVCLENTIWSRSLKNKQMK